MKPYDPVGGTWVSGAPPAKEPPEGRGTAGEPFRAGFDEARGVGQ
jgi:hypothetical protein